jgi:hypothetical protein
MSWTCKPEPEAQRDSEALLTIDLLQIQLIFIPNSWTPNPELPEHHDHTR